MQPKVILLLFKLSLNVKQKSIDQYESENSST